MRSSCILAVCLLAPAANAQAWSCFAGSPQHRAIAPAPAQPLRRVLWATPVDLDPQYQADGVLSAHYGSPVITAKNTIIVPVKTGEWDGFRVDARDAKTGALLYSLPTDYSTVSAMGWLASMDPAIGPNNSLFVPGAGGTVFVKPDADKAGQGPIRAVFYGGDLYTAQPALYCANVKICTPLTVDSRNNVWFGFRTYGDSGDETFIGKAGLTSGLARVNALGQGAWRSAKLMTEDPNAMRVQFQCAPALSNDGATVYVVVQLRNGGGYLVGLDTKTLATTCKARLIDPYSGGDAIIADQSTASPTVGPDGDVYIGVLSNPQEAHNKRGYLLHFDKSLAHQKVSGSFGWDSTASIIPAAAFPGYKGPSAYFIVSKYNNYALFGDGNNRVALLDPNVSTEDGIVDTDVMSELETISGPMSDPRWAGPNYPDAVYEWCINSAAVDVAGHSAIVNSEDGRVYRWDLLANRITEGVLLEGPRGQAYTPTVVGPTGIVYAINDAHLFAIGG